MKSLDNWRAGGRCRKCGCDKLTQRLGCVDHDCGWKRVRPVDFIDGKDISPPDPEQWKNAGPSEYK